MGSLPVLVVGIAGWSLYSLGSSNGEAKVYAKWESQKLKDAEYIAELRETISELEWNHRQETTRISYELSQANEAHARSVAALDAEYALRLSDSEKRAEIYQRMSDSGSTQSANLASYAAQLDRSLEEGRRLVKEFRATLEQRDQQLRLLGQQILSDRQLTGGLDGHSAASAE